MIEEPSRTRAIDVTSTLRVIPRAARWFAALALALAAAGFAAAPGLAQGETVRIAFNPQTYAFLPIFVAIEKGLFKEQGLDVRPTTHTGSALTQLPMLARGDLDIAPMVAGPAFFNQFAEGFGVKLFASLTESKTGWHDTTWLLVRKDVWDTGALKSFADLKGRTIELGPKGSPIYLTVTQALQQGGLTTKDVVASDRLRALTDALPLFRNKVVEVLALAEPIAGRLVGEGLAVRWKPSHEVMPWFQESYLAATPRFLSERRDATRRFTIAILKANQIVTAANGKWTPELAAISAKYAGLTEAQVLEIPGPQHVGQMGRINAQSLERLQEIWIAEGLTKVKTPLSDLVETTIAAEARKALGIE